MSYRMSRIMRSFAYYRCASLPIGRILDAFRIGGLLLLGRGRAIWLRKKMRLIVVQFYHIERWDPASGSNSLHGHRRLYRLTQRNEPLAMKLLNKHRELVRPIFPKYSGREVKTIGDGFLVEFDSALEATECAVELQETLHEYNETAKDALLVRVGIHVSDVIHREGDVYGDAVNIA